MLSDHVRPEAHSDVVSPAALNLDRRHLTNVRDEAEPGAQFCLAPPTLNANGSFNLPLREQLTTHEQFNAIGVVVLHYFLAFILAQGHTKVVLVLAVNGQLFLHVGDL